MHEHTVFITASAVIVICTGIQETQYNHIKLLYHDFPTQSSAWWTAPSVFSSNSSVSVIVFSCCFRVKSGLILIRISPDQHFLKQLSFTWFSINHVLVSNLIIRIFCYFHCSSASLQNIFISQSLYVWIIYISSCVMLSVKSRLKSLNRIMRKQASKFDFYHSFHYNFNLWHDLTQSILKI